MRVVAFVPAKGNSRRIERKNMQLISGQPLFLRQALKLASIPEIDVVVVDTDEEAIASLARSYGLCAIVREHNDRDGHELFASEVKAYPDADVYVQCLATAPFLTASTIREAMGLVSSGSYGSVATTWEPAGYAFPQSEGIDDSDQLATATVETMGLYVVSGDLARKEGKRCYADTMPIMVEPIEAFDIDYMPQLEMARLIAVGQRQRDVQRLRALSDVLSSALLADAGANVLYGINGVAGAKMIGRACTLELTDDKGEGTSIYDALKQYDYVCEGDVLVVGGDYFTAYFGGINSRLARRAGAVGAVINGATRDADDVVLPVFSIRNTPNDCRNKLYVKHIQRPMMIDDRVICPGDIIFGDGDGVVHIPAAREQEIMEHALHASATEHLLMSAVALGAGTDEMKMLGGEF